MTRLQTLMDSIQGELGQMVQSLQVVSWMDARAIMAVGRDDTLWVDFSSLEKYEDWEIHFLLLHEGMHLQEGHQFHRFEGRDRLLWNIACDLQVNSSLQKMGWQPIPEAFLPEEFGLDNNMETSQYFQWVKAHQEIVLAELER